MGKISAQLAFLAAGEQNHVEKPIVGVRAGSQIEIWTGVANIQCLYEHIIVRQVFVI